MTTDPETRALTAESEALLDRIHILNGRSFPLATREDFAAIEEAARRADEPRVAEGLTEFRALVDEARANHVRWEHEAEVLEECLRPLCIGAKMLLWPDIEDPRSSALPAPRPPEPVAASQVQTATVAEGTAIGNSRPPEPDRTAALRGLVERVASMGLCSQTHHEHLLTDARRALRALAATPEPAPVADGTARCGCWVCPCSNPSTDWRWCADCEAGNHVAGYRATPTPPTDGAA